ncbi:hypothetical protein K2F40_15860 [Clostridium sp. CM028]|uniref:hypothetical protein n=1 Tax=unclassified Clostridium TaxID=2614128 RepID=UPI001C6DE335|nr:MULTISPECIES: hypothetical protein [unclassified Clostridium]MBW9147212.1 hypothetical protein [Clostridium sp. CM027]MBW9150433.1 hypothetical protein [Clostridium sp. CM028]UVE42819.1 hypothetical protein KTC92_18380 [Clostridium sp. CM027]WLC63492.1 hypothetical protein KTC94_16990 [Clostridium sp. CM028]
MENIQKSKVGAGIKTISIITLIFSIFGLITSIKNMLNIGETNALRKEVGFPEMTILALVIGLLITIIIISGVILILMKKELGIYIYFIGIVAKIAYSIVSVGFSPWMLSNLIMPVLMAIFIRKKKEIFSVEAN